MALATLVNSTDISLWANRRIAQDQFPKFLRRLITTSTETLKFISMRADEGVQLEGFDGVLLVDKGNEFVPDGKSVWEFGTNKQVKSKADDDYNIRKKSIIESKKNYQKDKSKVNKFVEINPKETTYVFVTPRRWSKKDDWIAERRREKCWKEVRVYDADDLETWLELSPSVHVWLSILIGKHPENVIDLENFWLEWISVTNPKMSSELVISDRNQQSDKIKNWVEQNQPSSLTIKTESKSEAISFFAAVVNEIPNEKREKVFSKSLIIKDLSVWRNLSVFDKSLILIPEFDDEFLPLKAIENGHQVFIPLGKADAPNSSVEEIPRLNRASAEKALLNMGISENKVGKLATLARRGFLALRRKLAINPEIQIPNWAKPNEARNLLPILLVGGFNNSIQQDCEVISQIAQTEYETINNTLVRWSNESDSPIRQVGNVWMIASKDDSWSLVSRYLTKQDLERFETVALDILGKVDHQYDISPDDRWKASFMVKSIPNSGLLREGIAETLAIMASRSETTNLADSSTGQDWANRIVYKLLKQANEDWKLWASISYLLPLLAESAPQVFLEAVEEGLADGNPILLNIFSEGENSLTSSSPHTGLLWALETLAWHSDYLGLSSLLLAKLVRLDPGGKLGNRPDRSLRAIFLPWHPYTKASLGQRLNVIDAMRKREPEVAWKLQLLLLPKFHDSSSQTSTPRWREWETDEPVIVTNVDVWKSAVELVSRLVEDVGVDGKKWNNLINQVSNLPPEEQNLIINSISKLDINELSENDRLIIWNNLREIIARHREYPTSDWSMPSELTDKLEELYERFAPKNIITRNLFLFSSSGIALLNPTPYLKDDSLKHWDDNRNFRSDLKKNSVSELYKSGKIKLLLEFAQKVDEPASVGYSLGETNLITKSEDEFLLKNLASEKEAIALFTRGYVNSRFLNNGWEWVKERLVSKKAKNWSSTQTTEFLICLSFTSETWDIADLYGEEVKGLYWAKANGFPKLEDAERATREFLAYNRPEATIEFLSYLERKEKTVVPDNLIVEILTKLVSAINSRDIKIHNIGYNINSLFESLDKSDEVGDEDIAKLEWIYLPILENYGRGPKLLHKELLRNAEFFVEVSSYIYRAENEEKENNEANNNNETRATLAHKLLHNWRGCPGENEDGTFDMEHFRDWIHKSRTLFKEKGREKVGDMLIGERLAFAPYGSDGAFPLETVRDLIEELANKSLERNLEVQIFNNRGVTTKAMAEGGGQEKAIADRYLGYAKIVGEKHPRTSAMLRRIADNYFSHARREDLSAELEQDLWK
jgi:hypothetical protein